MQRECSLCGKDARGGASIKFSSVFRDKTERRQWRLCPTCAEELLEWLEEVRGLSEGAAFWKRRLGLCYTCTRFFSQTCPVAKARRYGITIRVTECPGFKERDSNGLETQTGGQKAEKPA